MRKLTLRDLLATLVVAALVVPFIGYSARGSMPVPMVAGLVIIWAAALLHDVGYIAPAHAVRHA